MGDSENNVCILEMGAIGLVLIAYLSASGSLILLATWVGAKNWKEEKPCQLMVDADFRQQE